MKVFKKIVCFSFVLIFLFVFASCGGKTYEQAKQDFAKYKNNDYSVGLMERSFLFFENHSIYLEDISGLGITKTTLRKYIWINDKIYFARIYEDKLYISSCDIYGENIQNEILFTEDVCANTKIYSVYVYKYTMYIQYKTAEYSKNNKNAIKIGSYNFETGEKQESLASGQEYDLSDFYPEEYTVEKFSFLSKEDYLKITKKDTNETYTINREFFKEYEIYKDLVNYGAEFRVFSACENIVYVAGEINLKNGCFAKGAFIVLKINLSTMEYDYCGIVDVSEEWMDLSFMVVFDRIVF